MSVPFIHSILPGLLVVWSTPTSHSQILTRISTSGVFQVLHWDARAIPDADAGLWRFGRVDDMVTTFSTRLLCRKVQRQSLDVDIRHITQRRLMGYDPQIRSFSVYHRPTFN